MRKQAGPYRIDGILGRGGMGVVYRGMHERLDRTLAIKALAPELTWQPEFRDRFFAEARTQARLQHPNILAVYDLLEDAGEFFIVMEHVNGSALDVIIRDAAGTGVALARAFEIISQVLLALDYAHSQAVIHRDVKPSNALVTADGRVKLTDFGIALLVGDKRLTSSRASIGTPIYMSPEQILRPRQMDHRADVYSAAIVLYEMLAGVPPFDAENEYEIKKLQIEAPPPDLCERRPDVSPAVSQAIRRALAKDPEARFASARGFLRALEAAAPPSLPAMSPLAGALDTVAAPATAEHRAPAFRDSTATGNSASVSAGVSVRPAVAVPARINPWPALAGSAIVLALTGLAFLLLRTAFAPGPPAIAQLPAASLQAASGPTVAARPPAATPVPADTARLPAPAVEPSLVRTETPAKPPRVDKQLSKALVVTKTATDKGLAAPRSFALESPQHHGQGGQGDQEDTTPARSPAKPTGGASSSLSPAGYVLEIQDLSIEPAIVRPGDTVTVKVRFLAHGPDPAEDITVLLFFGLSTHDRSILGRETSFALLHGGAALGEKSLVSTCRLTIPQTQGPVKYEITVTIGDAQGRFRQTRSRSFAVG